MKTKIKRTLPLFAVPVVLAAVICMLTACETTSPFRFEKNEDGYTLAEYKGSASAVEIPSAYMGEPVVSIGENAFNDRNKLEHVTIPSSVTSIGDQAFASCDKLASVTFGEDSQLTSIGLLAFSECGSLKSVTFTNPTGWYVTPIFDNPSGTNVTVTDAEQNAANLTSNYYNCYWYRK